MADQPSSPINHRPLLIKLGLVLVLMFGFAFALVPLYDAFCRVTGLNGKPENSAASHDGVVVDTSRTVTVEFIASLGEGMSWRFSPEVGRVQVHPGELKQVYFEVFNPTDHAMVGQAVPSIAPGLAAGYFHKTECFCFQQQPLAAGERQQLGLLFFIDPELPLDVSTLTLSYTLFDVSPTATSTLASR